MRHVGYPRVPTLLIEVQHSTHVCVEAGMYYLEDPRIYVVALAVVSWLYSTPELWVFNTLNVKRDYHDQEISPYKVLDNSRGRSSDDDSGGDRPLSGSPHLVDEDIAHETADVLKERPPHGCQRGVLPNNIRNMQDQANHCSTSRSI